MVQLPLSVLLGCMCCVWLAVSALKSEVGLVIWFVGCAAFSMRCTSAWASLTPGCPSLGPIPTSVNMLSHSCMLKYACAFVSLNRVLVHSIEEGTCCAWQVCVRVFLAW